MSRLPLGCGCSRSAEFGIPGIALSRRRRRSGILSVRFSKNGFLATTGRDGCVRIWNTKAQQVRSIQLKNTIPLSADLSSDGKTIVIGTVSDKRNPDYPNSPTLKEMGVGVSTGDFGDPLFAGLPFQCIVAAWCRLVEMMVRHKECQFLSRPRQAF